MGPQTTLFPLPPSPPYARRDTSIKAALEIIPSAAVMRREVFALILAAGSRGCTCDWVEQALELKHQTASARIWELRRDGLIRDSGKRGKTRSGRAATLWIAREQS